MKKSLLKSILETTLNKLFAVSSGLLVTAVLAQNLSKVEFGRYTFALTIVSLIGVPILLGIQRLLVRETARNRQFWDCKNVIAVHQVAALTAVLYSILFFIFLHSFRFLGYFEILTAQFILYSTLLLLSLSILGIFSSILRGYERHFLGNAGPDIIRPMLLFVFLLGCADISSYLHVVKLNIFTTIIAIIAIVWFSNKNLKVDKKSSISKLNIYQKFTPLLYFSGLAFVNVFSNNIDIFIITFLHGFETVAVLAIAMKVFALSGMPLTAINMVLQPRMASLCEAKLYGEVEHIASWCALLSASISVLIFTVLVVFGNDLLIFVFSEGFSAAFVPMLVLTASGIVTALYGPLGVILNMSGLEHITFRVSCIIAFANVILSSLLIYNYTVTGAAISIFLCNLVKSQILYIYLKRNLPIKCSILSIRLTNIPGFK